MYTMDEVVEVVKTLPRDRSNAVIDGACVYTDYEGNHCIAGEIMVRLGIELPEVSPNFGDDNRKLFYSLPQAILFGQNALNFISILQEEADRSTTEGFPDAWGLAIDHAFGDDEEPF